MIRSPAVYGFNLPTIPDAPYFRVVPTDGTVDLRLMAEVAGVAPAELHRLKPSCSPGMPDPDAPNRILVPEVVADAFTAKLAALDPDARARLGVHTVAPGESLASIAGRYKVPESVLVRMNADQRADLRAGDELRVPAGDVSQLRAGLGSDLERRIHRVKGGESLWSISRRYGMSVAQLARMNHLSTKTVLQPGQRLQVAGAGGSGASATGEAAPERVASSNSRVSYRVRRGDTLSTIARRFEVCVRDLQAWNNMGRSTALRAGQFLTIHVGGGADVGG